ncbi:MAG: hypothetical protein LBB22_00725 [Treponema sp.]|jgi:hypothetical protein|nr:hypothetical protein [Treponema sp.]
MKQRMLSVLTAGFFILAGFVGCSDDIGDISPDKSVHYIMKAGKINLDYIPSHIVVTYDELNGDLLYSATPGHILTGAVVTLLDGTSKTTTVTSEYTGTGDVKLIPDSDEGTYYDPAYTGKFDVGKAKQETVELITLKTTTLDVSYAGGLLHVLPQPLAEKIKWNNDPNKLVIDDFGNEILVLDGSVDDDNYYVDWMLYIYSDEYINEELAEDKAAERTASIEAATASQTDVNKALVISDYGDNIPENALINVAEIYDFNGVELFTKDYEKVVIHITSSAYVDKTDLISAILSAITAKTGVFVATAADQVPVGKKWVSTDALNTLQGLITAAETVRNNTDATQEEVKTATDNLTAGINTFNKAIGNGTAIAPADGWLDRSELGNKITEANALKIGYPIISKADTEGEGEAEDVAKVEEGFQYVGKAANEVLAGTISTAEALYAKPDSVLFTEAKALDGNSEKEDTAIKGIVQTNIVAQVDSLKSAMANFEKEVKKGTKNIQNEKTNPLPEGVPTDAGGKEIVFPPPPKQVNHLS